MKRTLLSLLLGLVLAPFAFADKIDGLPISVKITTSINYPDGSVQIEGTSNSLDDQAGEVTIELIKPGGATETLTALTDPKTGDYKLNYLPEEMGEYNITAYAPDKTQTAQTSFTVTAELDADEIIEKFDEAKDEAMNTVEDALRDATADAVSMEDVKKTEEKIQKTRQDLQTFDKGWTKMKASVKTLQELARKYPEIKKVAATDLAQLSSKLNETTDILKQVQASLAKSKSDGGDICNKSYQITESCALFSTTMNFASGGVIAIGKSIFVDKVWPKIAEWTQDKVAPKIKFSANDGFVFTQAGKAGLTAVGELSTSALNTTGFGLGMAGDLVQFLSTELFKKYCTEYKGPISGDFTMEFKNQGKTYLRHKVYYEGRISVYCLTTGLKASIPKLSGYIEANATRMEFTDDVWAVEDKSEWDEIKYQRIPAPVVPGNAADKDPGFGAVARAALPGSFYIPLEAQILQQKLIIKLLPAHSDITDAFMNRTILVAKAKQEPHNVSGAVFQYPLATGEFMLTRTMRMTPGDRPTIALDMTTKNGTTTVEKSFTRTESPDSDTKVDFNLKLKLSN